MKTHSFKPLAAASLLLVSPGAAMSQLNLGASASGRAAAVPIAAGIGAAPVGASASGISISLAAAPVLSPRLPPSPPSCSSPCRAKAG